jgi:Cu-processing system permease protein
MSESGRVAVTPGSAGAAAHPRWFSAGSAPRQILTLAAFTWKEGVRRRMVIVGLILTLAFVVLYALGGYFAFRHQNSLGIDQAPGAVGGLVPAGTDMTALMRQVAAYEMLSLGIFMASILTVTMLVFSSSGMISGDAENGTLQTIVTRPLARYQLLLGRYLGFASIFLAYLMLVTALLIGLTWAFSGYAPPDPVQAVCLIALQGLILLALSAVGTTLLPPLATGILVFMAYGLAFIAGVVHQIGTLLANHTAELIGTVVAFLVPSDLLFRGGLHDLAPVIPGPLSTIIQTGPFGTPSPVTPGMLLYCLGYLVVALTVSCWLFARKDL